MFVEELVLNRNGTLLDPALVRRFRDELVPAKDLDDLLDRYHRLAGTLDALGITKAADMKLNRLDHGMQVIIDLVPASRVRAKAGTNISSTGAEFSFEV